MALLTRLSVDVKPNQHIFCNTPWYELHIYWDGSLGICCQEDHKLYSQDQTQYNIVNMSLGEWFQSEPVKDFRRRILGGKRVSECSRCYLEEDHGGHSRRLRSNQKSVIFTTQAFEPSFQQSPAYHKFQYSLDNQGATVTQPIDLHIDLGNFCNLACKMCNAQASSTIASQEVRWGIESSRRYLGQDWTRNQQVWNKFKQDLLTIRGLNNIHFMGGETLLTDRLEDLVDFMIANNKFDLNLSFVTNGTVFDAELIEKLKLFRRVGIEVSIETVDKHNAYQRQGTDTNLVLSNIDRYLALCDTSSVTVSLRPAPSLLTIGYHHTLLKYALDKKLIVKSNLCYDPRHLNIDILPAHIKKFYQQTYLDLISQFDQIENLVDYNASDPNNYQQVIKQQAQMCVNLLQSPTPPDSEQQLELMVRHCERWDRIYEFDARILYPEFKEILDRYGYTTSG